MDFQHSASRIEKEQSYLSNNAHLSTTIHIIQHIYPLYTLCIISTSYSRHYKVPSIIHLVKYFDNPCYSRLLFLNSPQYQQQYQQLSVDIISVSPSVHICVAICVAILNTYISSFIHRSLTIWQATLNLQSYTYTSSARYTYTSSASYT